MYLGPLLIIDPDGRDITIYHSCQEDENGQQSCQPWTFNGQNAAEGRKLGIDFINSFLDAYTAITSVLSGTSLQQAAESEDYTIGLRLGVAENTGGRFNVFQRRPPGRIKGDVFWNPQTATLYDTGLVGSPAVNLAHEFGHAVHFAEDPLDFINQPDGGPYSNGRERYVIAGEEQRVARALGLIGPEDVTRTNHNGEYFITNSPLYTTLDRKATYLFYQALVAKGYNFNRQLRKYRP